MQVRLTLLLMLAAAPAFAQPAAPPAKVQTDEMAAFEKDLDALFVTGGLTSEQAASRAGAVSPTVMRRVAEVEAQIAQAEAAEIQRIPQVGVHLSYTRNSFIPPLSFGPGATFAFPQNYWVVEGNGSLAISDYIWRYPKLIDAAKLALQVAKTSKASAVVNAGEDARLAYYDWVRSVLGVLIAERQLAQVQTTLKQVRALADVQRLSRADLLRVESQEADAERQLDQIQHIAALREEQLRILIGAPTDEKLAIGEDIRKDVTPPQIAGLDESVRHATAHRLDVRTLDQGIAAKTKQTEAEKASYYPRLSAFGLFDYAKPNQRVFPLVDELKFTWSAGLSLTWNLSDTLYAGTNVHRYEAETDELRADRENLLRGTRVEIMAAQQGVELSITSLSTTLKGLQAAEEGYRVRKELLAADRATAVELVDSQTDLTRARISALNARVDLRVAIAQLVHAMGDDTNHH